MTSHALAYLTADIIVIGGADGISDHVLLIKRGKEPFVGRYALPGGHLHEGEAPEQAARRELLEETGLDLSIVPFEFVGAWGDPRRDPRGRYVSFVFSARVYGLPAVKAADDASTAEWISAIGGFGIPFAFDHRDILREALRT
ncbi:MAG TPA: NUDIX hydrolase [Polyangiaceae bacterium]|jgi:8-oxo-dGTP diphosphatase